MSKSSNKDIEAVYPLSPMQQGMLFHTIFNPDSNAYFEQFTCKLQGEIDKAAFQKAWQTVVQRHDSLRTAFVWKKLAKMLQVVHKTVELPLLEEDWSNLDEEAQKAKLKDLLRADREKGFNLSKAPLMRFYLIRLRDTSHQFLWSFHHLLTDGWSMPIILKEVFTLYEARQRGMDATLPKARPYKDYINWLQQQDQSKARVYWQEVLQDFAAPTTLKIERSTESQQTAEDDYTLVKLELNKALFEQLNALTRNNDLTISTLVQGAWALLLSRYSMEEDILFGVTVSGRPPELPGVENMVGLFINTLPLRVTARPRKHIIPWLKEIQSRALEMREFEYTPLVDIHGWSQVPRDLPLFNSIVVYENYPVDPSMKDQTFSLAISDIRSFERTNYPLTLVAASRDTLVLEIAFERQRYEENTIAAMLQHLQTILQGFASHSEGRLSDLKLPDHSEIERMTQTWNDTHWKFPEQLCLQQLFEQQVAQRPDDPALCFNGRTLTYRELNGQINSLAHFLRRRGLEVEDIVAIYLERSMEMIIALLAVIKAGGAYVPIDPEYPLERVRYILKDSNARFIISSTSLMKSIDSESAQIINLTAEQDAIQSEPMDNPAILNDPRNLAYVIYTSGSTGQPKGTLLQHRGAVNMALALGEHFRLKPGKSILQFSSLGFDASVAEIFGALINGAALHLTEKQTILSEQALLDYLRKLKTTTIIFPPAVLAMLSEENLPDLELVGSAGEACSREVLLRWSRNFDFVNGYGPTENTVSTSLYHHHKGEPVAGTVPIGKAMQNVRVYVLDACLNPQPVGVPGQLYLAGVGLSRGYLNRPDLTAEKFIPDPFASIPGSRMYASGDLVRYRPDGQLEFLGRVDHQVKIRGFRIELGEIEAALIDHPDIRSAVVLAFGEKSNNLSLVAYVIPNDTELPETEGLQEFLRKRLPDYMIPALFISMESFPLTASGKINRKALPQPRETDLESSSRHVAPRNPVETIITNIWRALFKKETIGIKDNFFALGGHSLLATQLISRLRDAFDIEIALRDFFEAPTIEALALEIEKSKLKDEALLPPPIEPAGRKGHLPLSFAQQRLWFLDQLAPGGSFYNIPSAIRLKGKLDLAILKRCINEIIRRHESLRTTFSNIKGEPAQVIHPEMVVRLELEDLRHLPEAERNTIAHSMAVSEATHAFNLESGPLFRTRLLHLADDDFIMLFTLHHIISDGWSMGVLIKEVAALYEAFMHDQESPLPDLPLQYADFAVWQRNWLRGEVLEKQMTFWKNEIGLNPPVLDLPVDHPRPAMQTFRGKTLNTMIPKPLSDQLTELSQKEGVTLFMTLLAGFQSLMHRYSGQDTVLVGSPIANRNHSDTEQLIGFFVNTLVLKADFSDNPEFRTLLKQVRERTLKAYAHQDLPFEQLVEVLQPERDMSHSPLFQVAFILQNVPLEPIELHGITIHPFEVEQQSAKYDLSFYCIETAQGIKVSIEYNTDLFMDATIERLSSHYQNLLHEMVSDPKQKVSHVNFLSAAEKKLMQKSWNATESPFPSDKTVHKVFEEWAEQNPDNTALLFNGEHLTYRELNERANQLAAFLRKKGVGPETLVGIAMPRSLDVPVAILGILKAGGAFLPIDPAYPPERIQYMIADSQISALITHDALADQFKGDHLNIIRLDTDGETIRGEAKDNPESPVMPANLAYIIYTSGSTGQPKGTMLQHQGLCNLSRAQKKAFNVQPGSRILQFAPMSFDASVWETVMALLNGGCLVLTDQESLTSGQGLLSTLKENQVNIVTLPPSVLAVMPEDELPELKTIVTAGEKCTADLVHRWGRERQFVNAYGPTETTVCASMYETDPTLNTEPPIGRPIDNFQLYVLDKDWQAVPIGVPGELCVGGVGLARGYLRRPALTAEKFIPDPFSGKRGSRLYRTGDLVRYQPDGNLEFLGRIDFQVKLRGFRIELGEIEAVLTSYANVRDAAVIVREDTPGDQRLVAYYVSENGAAISGTDLRRYLKQQLPEYMIPSIFVSLESMPLTPSGKVDRKALPRPEISREKLAGAYVAPRNETEEKLAQIAARLLNLEKVGVEDNFFELGGHSLLATRFISQIREAFQVELPLRDLFEAPTVAGLAERIKQGEQSEEEEIIAVQRGDQSLDDLLSQLDGLSDEEAKALLNEAENEKIRGSQRND